MSQITLQQKPVPVEADALRDRLSQEFQNPAPGRIPPLFQIDRPGDRVHILVVWDEWQALSLRERSRITLEAYELAFGMEAMLEVSVALGLTNDEAHRMGYDL